MNECFDFDITEAEASAFGLESILNILPIINVAELGDVIEVRGLWAFTLASDIKKAFKTQRVANNIFIEINRRSFTFHRFFTLEVMEVLRSLLNTSRRNTPDGVIEDIMSGIQENTWYGKAVNAEPIPLNKRNLKRLNVSLLPKQSEFIERYAKVVPRNKLRGMLLAAGAGTGKTINGFGWHLCMGWDVTIFIVPNNSLDEVWRATIETRFDKVPEYWISNGKDKIRGREEFLVCHYEALPKMMQELGKFKNKKVGIWIDESHNFNDTTSSRTNRIIDLCNEEYIEGVVWASGTPLKALAKESIPLFSTIDPFFTAEVRSSFTRLHSSNQKAAMELLATRLDSVTFKVPKKTVVATEEDYVDHNVKMPNGHDYTLESIGKEVTKFVKERKDYHVEHATSYYAIWLRHLETDRPNMPPSLYSRYQKIMLKMNRDFNIYNDIDILKEAGRIEREHILPVLLPTDRKEFRKMASRVRVINLVIRGEALGYIGKFRANCVLDMIPHMNLEKIIAESEKKTLIFTSYIKAVVAAKEYLVKQKLEPLIVYGETNKDLNSIMDRLDKDPKANPIIATYDSLSTAVPVIQCNTAVFMNLAFREYIMEQARSRIARLGQDTQVHFVSVYLDTGEEPNITTRTSDILEWSKESVDIMLNLGNVADGIKEEVSLESAFFYATDHLKVAKPLRSRHW